MKWRVLATIIATCAGCGVLSGLDSLDVGDGGSDAIATDAAFDDSQTCDAGACGAPDGFQPILFSSDRASSCPGTSFDVVVDPAVPSGACACACDETPQAMCLPHTLAYHAGDTCSNFGTVPFAADGGCNAVTTQITTHANIATFPATCASIVKTAVPTSVAGRRCPLAGCNACSAPPGFELCFATSGAALCPPNMTRHTIADATHIDCSACAPCSLTSGTCSGTLEVYDNAQCNGGAAVPIDGTCQIVGVGSIAAIKYVPTVVQVVCSPGTSTASLALDGQTTVCCP